MLQRKKEREAYESTLLLNSNKSTYKKEKITWKYIIFEKTEYDLKL